MCRDAEQFLEGVQVFKGKTVYVKTEDARFQSLGYFGLPESLLVYS